MSQTLHRQFLDLLERSERPLIVLPHHAHVDDIVTAYAIATFLQKLQKPSLITSSGGPVPKALSFLDAPAEIKGDVANVRNMTIIVKGNQTKVDELSYTVKDGDLEIHLKPKSGTWNADDVIIKTDSYHYDTIITIGATNYESLGTLFEQYKDFFFETPIINIDHKTDNEHFGQLNVVDINKVSCSEVCYDLFKTIDETLIDNLVATYLLTGMIAKTQRFTAEKVHPKTLKTAGDLIARGANRDQAVQHLYKTKTVETLRLWGRALARLKSDSERNIVWTVLTREDFVHAGATENDLEHIIEELISTSPEAQVSAVFYEQKNGDTHGLLSANRPFDALSLGAPFGASGTRESAHLRLKETDLVIAEKRVIEHIKSRIDALR